MLNQGIEDNASLKDRFLSGLLVREQLERVGLGGVADIFGQPSVEDKPTVSVTRRRGRPFSPIEAAVVAEEDADAASALLSLTRTLDAGAAAQAERNAEIYKLYLQTKLG